MNNITISIAFAAGLLSFFSPCVLPLIPSYIVYLTGISLKDLGEGKAKINVLINSLLFVLGLSTIFIMLGAASTFFGNLFFNYKDLIRTIGSAVIIIFGLNIMGVFKLKFLSIERRINLGSKSASFLGSYIIGLTFAAAWTPCVGPILGSILVLSSKSQSMYFGAFLLFFYCIGLSLPFIITAIMIRPAMEIFRKTQKYMYIIELLSGALLILVGIFVYLGKI